MMIQLRAPFFCLLLASFGTLQAQTLTASEKEAGPRVEAATPITPQHLLENIKRNLDQGDYLKNGFYDPENLHKVFGDPYTFKPILVPKELNIRVIELDSVTPAVDNQQQPAPAKDQPLPLFNNGKIYLTDLHGTDQVLAHFVITLNLISQGQHLLNSALVQKVFGKPTSITPVNSADSSDSDGNWLNYQTQRGDLYRNILFKANEDGVVSEMHIYVGRTQ